MNKLRVGLLLDSFQMVAWKHEIVSRLLSSTFSDVVLVFLNDSSRAKESFLPRSISTGASFLYRLYRSFEARRFHPRPDAFKMKDSTEMLREIPAHMLRGDWSTVRESNLDVLVDLGTQRVEGDMKEAPRYGVWSYGSTPPDTLPIGFWEVLHADPVTSVSLFKRDSISFEETSLFRSFSATDKQSAYINRSRLYWKASSFIPRELGALYNLAEGLSRKRSDRFQFAPLPTVPDSPTFRNLFSPVISHMSRLLWKRIERVFKLDQWILLYSLHPKTGSRFSTFRKMIPPKDRVWADPFILFRDGKYYIFIEECPIRPKKGYISVIVMNEQGEYEKPHKIVEQPYHLSYPFLLEWNGELYMIPESSANRTIDLYRCTDFPFGWKFEKSIMTNVDAVDTTLVQHGGKWWLFATIRENGGYPNWDELFIFSAEQPLSEYWTPHPLNPVVSDVRRARPAGRFLSMNGRLFRPSQDCSRRYGYGLRFQLVTRLTETEYEEEEVGFVEPQWDPRISAVHTFSREANLSVIDGMYRRSR